MLCPGLRYLKCPACFLQLLFDALHPSSTAAGAQLFPPLPPEEERPEPPPDWLVTALNRALQEALGLTLFGYDLVREEGSGQYFLLDVNYFPTYTGYEGVLDDVADSIQLVTQCAVGC